MATHAAPSKHKAGCQALISPMPTHQRMLLKLADVSFSRPFQRVINRSRSLAMRCAKKCCAPLTRLNAGPTTMPVICEPDAPRSSRLSTTISHDAIRRANQALERKSRALFLRRCTIAPWSAGSRLGNGSKIACSGLASGITVRHVDYLIQGADRMLSRSRMDNAVARISDPCDTGGGS